MLLYQVMLSFGIKNSHLQKNLKIYEENKILNICLFLAFLQ